MAYRELLIGCGNHRVKQVFPLEHEAWSDVTTLDLDPNCRPDIEHDLERLPLPFDGEDLFDEIHAYHVLEHIGAQGDYKFFFALWSEFWRILKPDGAVCAIVPGPQSQWVWADPGHKNFFHPHKLTFLDQDQYTLQVGHTAFADYRHVYRADFKGQHFQNIDDNFAFLVTAVKPSRISI